MVRLDLLDLLSGGFLSGLGLIGLRLKETSFRFLDPGLHLLHRLLELGEGSLRAAPACPRPRKQNPCLESTA